MNDGKLDDFNDESDGEKLMRAYNGLRERWVDTITNGFTKALEVNKTFEHIRMINDNIKKPNYALVPIAPEENTTILKSSTKAQQKYRTSRHIVATCVKAIIAWVAYSIVALVPENIKMEIFAWLRSLFVRLTS